MLTFLKNDPFYNAVDKFFETYHYVDAPKVNIRKNEGGYKVQMSVPGLTKDDLKIKVKDGILEISYKKENETDKSYFVSSFSRAYTLPDDIKETDIDGRVENGVLELFLPIEKVKTSERLISLK